MSPPTEQLIRDYLNRLSVAARGRLGAEDRRTLVTRTRDFIERNASQIGPANPMQVAALLSRLGDPAALVDEELSRLGAVRGDAESKPPGRDGKLAGRLRRRSGSASWHWPRPAGSHDLQIQVLNGTATEPDESAIINGPVPIWVPRQFARSDEATPASVAQREEPAVSSPQEAVASETISPLAATGSKSAEDAAAAGKPTWPSVVARSPDASTQPAGAPAPQGLTTAARQTRPIAVLAATLLRRARANPIEAVATILLGLGGAAYPPVWLLGAVVTLASKVWDYRDRWIGLGGPVLLLVVGTSAGVSLGTSHSSFGSYVHEGWIYADVLSRVGAVLGAYYLAWRVAHARRTPNVPPWNRPHKVD
jgi:hypothetical protein